LFTVAKQTHAVTNDNDDVLRDRLLTKRDVNHHHQRQQQHDANSRRQHSKQRQADSDSGIAVFTIDSLSDVLLTRVFYSGLASDDLCRCAAVCRRWNRLVWNPLLWTCVDLSRAPDCDADTALR